MAKKQGKKPSAESIHCPSCGEPADSDDRFCRKCGTALSADAKTNGGLGGLTGLRAFGLAIIVLAIFYIALQYGKGSDSSSNSVPTQRIGFGDVGSGPAQGSATESMTPREAADALFDRAMYAHETGDAVTAQQFVPMAIQAYEDLPTLDTDARYHVALLELANNQPEAALEQAEIILAEVPNHLLALTASARAYEQLGRTDLAVDRYQRFLENYTPDVATSRPEYIAHTNALASQITAARAFVAEHAAAQ
jgi:tetratricopeptide (TPR) repeat protein